MGFGDELTHAHREAVLLRECFANHCDQIGVTDNSRDADAIIFVGQGGLFQEEIRKNNIFKRYREKCMLFCTSDNVIPILPGLYASLDRRFRDKVLHRGGFYIEDPDLDLIQKISEVKVRYLFSFMGNCNTHKIRDNVMQLADHDRGMIKDVGNRAQVAWSQWDMQNMKRYSGEYCKLIQESMFVLCPRGNGTTSIRLFETMKLGRVPVIISDNWVPPIGPDWDQCSIRIKEKDIQEIPDVLTELEASSNAMGKNAEEEWNQWFSNHGCIKSITGFLNIINDTDVISKLSFSRYSNLGMMKVMIRYYAYKLMSRLLVCFK